MSWGMPTSHVRESCSRARADPAGGPVAYGCGMRIWSLHPSLLDRAALVAGWRETLLAQKVLRGLTKGYTNHPQLDRFRATPDPVVAVAAYLAGLADEADARGYRFDRSRIVELTQEQQSQAGELRMSVTQGQVEYEWSHLRAKVDARAPEWAQRLSGVSAPTAHPLFDVVPGGIESWERP